MITYVNGNLFESPAQVLVNTVNTFGVMGRGIAKEFKQIYPDMFTQYQRLCENGQLQVGMLWLYKTANKWILNFPTKKHWRYPSKVEYIEAGLQKFVETYSHYGIHSIAFPALGCGNGELDFDSVVRPLMESYLGGLPIDVFIYAYDSDPFIEHKAPEEFRQWLRSEPATLAFSEVWSDIVELLSSQTEFETAVEKSKFTATLKVEPEEGVRFESAAGRVRFISKDVFLQIWQQIRTHGYLKRETSPIYGSDVMFPIGLLENLPYLQRAQIADSYPTNSSNWAIGLQFDPSGISHSQEPIQLPLF